MRKTVFCAFAICLAMLGCKSHGNSETETTLVPTDSIRLSDPAVLADEATGMYYMTGTGGQLWKSKDLKMWDGPYDVIDTEGVEWMGEHPHVWAAEIHKIGDKYYYFATFTNYDEKIGQNTRGVDLERRACHVLVSDKPDGPYKAFGDQTYLPADKLTLDGTYWRDADGKPYMVYCHEWLQNDNGTIEKIELKPDLSGAAGEGQLLFKASDSPWSREIVDGVEVPNRVTDGPWLFRTDTGRLGMIWTSWVYDVYTQGVAYSESGTLDGPWTQQAAPITPPNYGHGMIFRDFDGRAILSCHSHNDVDGRYVRVPRFFEIDLSTDSLIVKGL